MKAIFVNYNQAYNEEIVELLESAGERGFTRWDEVQGRGSESGLPHLGNHAWPVMNQAVFAVVPDEKVQGILDALKAKDLETPDLGLRAFVWNVEQMY